MKREHNVRKFDDHQIEILKEGAEAWHAWRKENQATKIKFDRKQFETLKKGATHWNQWRENNPEADVDLEGANLSNLKLEGVNLRKARLQGAVLSGARLSKSNLQDAELIGVNFSKAILQHADLQNANLSGANMFDAQLSSANLIGATLDWANCTSTHFQNVELSDAFLIGTNLERANFGNARLDNAHLNKSRIEGTSFGGTEMQDADLIGCTVDAQTNFTTAKVNGLKIEKLTVMSLTDDRKPTPGACANMKVTDPVIELRKTFGGYLTWIHAASIFIFLFPLALFFLKGWAVAGRPIQSSEEGEKINLLLAFSRHIYYGGEGLAKPIFLSWPHWSLALFIFVLAYNFCRVCMIAKTKDLELHEEASGYPKPFSLTEPLVQSDAWYVKPLKRISFIRSLTWNSINWFVNKFMIVYLLCTLVHAGHFLTTNEVSIEVLESPLMSSEGQEGLRDFFEEHRRSQES